ncbi:MAG: DUF47 family protein [bacterium]
MFKRLLPKETNFFNYFEEHISLTVEMAELLVKLGKDYDNLDVYATKIRKLEKKCDEITLKCVESLIVTFITPFERTEIHKLITRLDDIADGINGTVQRLIMYKIKSTKKIKNIRPEFYKIAEIILKQTKVIQETVKALRETKKVDFVKGKCEIVRMLEKDADEIFKEFVVAIFDLEDCKDIIKWKEIFERLESIPDRCEIVANLVETIIISAS